MEDPDAEILIETMSIGNAAEVRAISAADGLEVCFQVPASASEADIHRLARAKLSFVRSRGAAGKGGPENPPKRRGGVIV